jgi:hypothetical protein
MKKIFASALIAIVIPAVAFAAILKENENLGQSEVVSGNLYMTGSAPVVAGTINGDLVAAGGTVIVTGSVSQDVLVAGGNVNMTGPVGGDLRAFGGNVVIDCTVQGEVFTAGGEVQIGPNAVIQGDLIASGGSVKVNPAAKVYGNKKIQTGEDVQKDAGGALREMPKFFQTAFLVGQLVAILGLLIVACLMFGLAPALTKRIVAKTLEKGYIWRNLGLGVLMMLLLPISALICFVTGVGAMLGFLLLFGFIIYILYGVVVSGIIFGGWLYQVTKKPKKPCVTWGALVLGVVLLHIISIIPVIGWLVVLIFILISWGGTLRMKFEIIRSIK